MLKLTAFFDESGHAGDPNVNVVGMAGFVAPLAEWINFNERWKDILTVAGILGPFHMKDFVHSKGEFKSWKGDEGKRKLLLRRLIEIITETNATPIGSAVLLRDFASLTPEQRSQFLDPYYICFQTCTRGAAIKATFEEQDESVSMVYAFQEEFGANKDGRARQLWDTMKHSVSFANIGQRMESYASDNPADKLPLQAADLFAYELCHEFENHVKRPNDKMRWGLRQILKMYRTPIPFIRMFDRKELLRLVSESQMPDQSGVEELSAFQEDISRREMTDWLLGRAEYSKERDS